MWVTRNPHANFPYFFVFSAFCVTLAMDLVCELLALVLNIQYLFNSKFYRIVEISSFMRVFLFAV